MEGAHVCFATSSGNIVWKTAGDAELNQYDVAHIHHVDDLVEGRGIVRICLPLAAPLPPSHAASALFDSSDPSLPSSVQVSHSQSVECSKGDPPVRPGLRLACALACVLVWFWLDHHRA